MGWWRVIDSSTWEVETPEGRGKRPKGWMRCRCCHTRWLRKNLLGFRPELPLGRGPQEAAIEAFTLELARRSGIEASQGHCSVWHEQGSEIRGFVSLNFQSPLEEQYSGEELMGHLLWGIADEKERRAAVTLAAAKDALEQEEKSAPCSMVGPFVRMLVFDAIVGVNDRHRLNWAVLRGPNGSRLAPMFDTAGCLGSELADPTVDGLLAAGEARLTRYAERCKSGFGDGGRRQQIPQYEVLREIRSWPGFVTEVGKLCTRFEQLMGEQVSVMLEEIPDDWLSAPRKRLAAKMLALRVRLVRGEAWR